MPAFTNYLAAKKISGLKNLVSVIDAENAKECASIIKFLAKQKKLDLTQYLKPIVTDTPIFDDLPEENIFAIPSVTNTNSQMIRKHGV